MLKTHQLFEVRLPVFCCRRHVNVECLRNGAEAEAWVAGLLASLADLKLGD